MAWKQQISLRNVRNLLILLLQTVAICWSQFQVADILKSANLRDDVQERTHRYGHILGVSVTSTQSHHFLITINVSLQKQTVSDKVISYRKYKSIVKEAILADLRISSLVLDPSDDVNHLVNFYDSTLKDIVDEQHAPLRTKEMPRRPMLPRSSKNILAAKRHRRYCERLSITTSWVFIMKCSGSVQFFLKIPLSLLNLNIIRKRSKHSREIKGLFSVLWIKY